MLINLCIYQFTRIELQVSNLLKRIKEKKELTRFLRSEDSFSQPLGYYKPHSSDPLYVHQEDSSEIERKEFMTAQQLISRVNDTIGSNKLLFEEWMIEGIGSRYEVLSIVACFYIICTNLQMTFFIAS